MEYCKPWFNSDVQVLCQWQFTDADPVGVPTTFGTRIWEDQDTYSDPLSGQAGFYRKPSTWNNGWSGQIFQAITGTCADASKLYNGFDINTDPPLPPV